MPFDRLRTGKKQAFRLVEPLLSSPFFPPPSGGGTNRAGPWSNCGWANRECRLRKSIRVAKRVGRRSGVTPSAPLARAGGGRASTPVRRPPISSPIDGRCLPSAARPGMRSAAATNKKGRRRRRRGERPSICRRARPRPPPRRLSSGFGVRSAFDVVGGAKLRPRIGREPTFGDRLPPRRTRLRFQERRPPHRLIRDTPIAPIGDASAENAPEEPPYARCTPALFFFYLGGTEDVRPHYLQGNTSKQRRQNMGGGRGGHLPSVFPPPSRPLPLPRLYQYTILEHTHTRTLPLVDNVAKMLHPAL